MCALAALAARAAYAGLASPPRVALAAAGGAGRGALGRAAQVLRSAALVTALALALACAVLSKETGITLVAVLATHELLRGDLGGQLRQRILSSCRLALLALFAAAYLVARMCD